MGFPASRMACGWPNRDARWRQPVGGRWPRAGPRAPPSASDQSGSLHWTMAHTVPADHATGHRCGGATGYREGYGGGQRLGDLFSAFVGAGEVVTVPIVYWSVHVCSYHEIYNPKWSVQTRPSLDQRLQNAYKSTRRGDALRTRGTPKTPDARAARRCASVRGTQRCVRRDCHAVL
jgi:hypothetical protein